MNRLTPYIVFCFTATAYTQFVSYKTYEYDPTNVDLFFYEKTTMTVSVGHYEHATGTNLAHCRSRCAQEQPKCRNVVIIIHGANQENIECKFYDVDGTVSYGDNSRLQLISIHMFVDKPFMRPSGYCRELDYMNLCGNCSCHDMDPPSKTPFYCDCTKAVGVKLHCKEVLHHNPNSVSGLYEIKPDEAEKFTVYCRFSDDGKAMTRFIRRVDKDTDILAEDMEYYEYNQKALMNDSMLGLHYAQRLTSGYEMALWVEYVRWDGVFAQAKYCKFNLSDAREYRMQYNNDHNCERKDNIVVLQAMSNPSVSIAVYHNISGKAVHVIETKRHTWVQSKFQEVKGLVDENTELNGNIQTGKIVSFKLGNNLYLRHRDDSYLYLDEKPVIDSAELRRFNEDASFVIREQEDSYKDYIRFESYNYPGYFILHWMGRVHIESEKFNPTYKEHSSFLRIPTDDGSLMDRAKGGEFKNQGDNNYWWTSQINYHILKQRDYASYLQVDGDVDGKDQHVIFYLLHE